jgi:hypothetical protein
MERGEAFFRLRSQAPAGICVLPALFRSAGLSRNHTITYAFQEIAKMNAVTRKRELWSIALLGAAFVIFTIAIPLLKDSIDTTNEHYTDYKFNLQQSNLNHGKFITTYKNAHFLELLLQENIVTEQQQVSAALKIRDRLGLRCQELLADAIMSASADPGDAADDAVSRHRKLRHPELGELIKE